MSMSNQSFKDERIELHGKSFHNCTFENCELIFDGDRPPTLKDNHFTDSTFVFTGAATRTLYLLSNIYHAGDGGKEVINKLLPTFAIAPCMATKFARSHRIRLIIASINTYGTKNSCWLEKQIGQRKLLNPAVTTLINLRVPLQ